MKKKNDRTMANMPTLAIMVIVMVGLLLGLVNVTLRKYY